MTHVPLSTRRKRTMQVTRDDDNNDSSSRSPTVAKRDEEFVVFMVECSSGSATRMFGVPTRLLEDELMDIDRQILDHPEAELAYDDSSEAGVMACIGRRLGLANDDDDDDNNRDSGDLASCEIDGSSCFGRIRCVIRGSCDQ